VQLCGAGSKSEYDGSICAWESFCCIVRILDNEKTACMLLQESTSKEMYKDLRFTKCSKGATRKMTLIQLMNNVGYTTMEEYGF
jgi:hypothetical protein